MGRSEIFSLRFSLFLIGAALTASVGGSCAGEAVRPLKKYSLGFDGTAHAVCKHAADLIPREAGAFEIRFYPLSAGDQKIIGKTPIGSGYVIGIDENRRIYAEFWDREGRHFVLLAGEVELGRWNHVLITYSPREKKAVAYLNGREAGFQAISDQPLGHNSSPFVVGAAPWDTSSFTYRGLVSRIRIYDASFTAWEAQKIFRGAVARDNLAAEWLFRQGAGSVVPDSSGKGHALQLKYTKWVEEKRITEFADLIHGPQVEPVWLKKPRASIYPRSKSPAEPFYLFDGSSCDLETRFFLTTLQGMVNRDRPRLYLCLKKPSETANPAEDLAAAHDRRWYDWLRKNGYLPQGRGLRSVEEVIATFKPEGVIQPDPDFPASVNLATMLAGVKGIPAAFPATVKKYGLHVEEDLRGRWKTNTEAYRWAFETLWPQMDHTCLAFLAPSVKLAPLRDYLTAKRIFTFWITGSKDGKNAYSNPALEAREIGRILGRMPVNIPVLGYPWAGDGVGIGEGGGVRLLSRYAKFLVPTDWKGNLSVWTGLEAKTKKFTQKPPRPLRLDRSKIYVTFLMSDGDNLNTWYDYFPAYWKSELRGRIPIAWTMGPSLIDLQAPLLDYYYSTLSETDSFGAAVSGIGYVYPQYYAAAYGKERAKVWYDFLDLTARYMRKLDQRWIWTMGTGERKGKIFRDYVSRIPSLKAIFADYGGKTPYEKADYVVDGVPVFHSINRSDKKRILIDIRSQIPSEPPAFMHVFLLNWNYKYQDIKKLVDSLPRNVLVVRPDELAALYLEYIKSQEHKK